MTRQNHILHKPASELELPRLGRARPKNIFSAQEAERIMQCRGIGPSMSRKGNSYDKAKAESFMKTLKSGAARWLDRGGNPPASSIFFSER